jgi:hypothetical protein
MSPALRPKGFLVMEVILGAIIFEIAMWASLSGLTWLEKAKVRVEAAAPADEIRDDLKYLLPRQLVAFVTGAGTSSPVGSCAANREQFLRFFARTPYPSGFDAVLIDNHELEIPDYKRFPAHAPILQRCVSAETFGMHASPENARRQAAIYFCLHFVPSPKHGDVAPPPAILGMQPLFAELNFEVRDLVTNQPVACDRIGRSGFHGVATLRYHVFYTGPGNLPIQFVGMNSVPVPLEPNG